jgi:hypothetical protein
MHYAALQPNHGGSVGFASPRVATSLLSSLVTFSLFANPVPDYNFSQKTDATCELRVDDLSSAMQFWPAHALSLGSRYIRGPLM